MRPDRIKYSRFSFIECLNETVVKAIKLSLLPVCCGNHLLCSNSAQRRYLPTLRTLCLNISRLLLILISTMHYATMHSYHFNYYCIVMCSDNII